MAGRAFGRVVSNAVVEVAAFRLDRTRIVFTCAGSADGAVGTVVLRDGDVDVTTTNGVPLHSGFPLVIEGLQARKRWTAIRLSAADQLVGVIEGFPDNYAMAEPDSGVPL